MISFADRYRVEATLGQGAFGTVYRARDVELDRLVAVKVLRPDVTTDEVRARFEREARLAASVEHPHVVRLLDHGSTENGAPFLVFEFVQGASLEDRLERPVELAQWITWMRDVAAGLAALHEVGVLHRDLKPANVLVHEDGRAMLADMGLARSEEATFDGLTATGSLVGTPLYMAPELFTAGGGPSPEADLFALGCLAYRGLYGEDWRRPESFQAMVDRTLDEAGEAPAARFGRHPAWDPWLRDLLHADPQARLGPASRVAEALAESPSPPPPPLPSPRPGARRWLAGAFGVAALVVGGLAMAGRAQEAPAPAPPTPPALDEEAVTAAKDEVRRRGEELPRMDWSLGRKEAVRVLRKTQVDYRTPLKFKRFLGAIQQLQALGYLPANDEFWYRSVLRPTQMFLAAISDIGPPRIAGTVLEVSSLEWDQSFREKMNSIQNETRAFGLAFVDAASRGGRMGRHWREDLLLPLLSRHTATGYGEVFVRSFLAGLEAERSPPWRNLLIDDLGKIVSRPGRFGLDDARAEEIARELVSYGQARLGPDLEPEPLGHGELNDLITAELLLRHRRAWQGRRDAAADVRCDRLIELALARGEAAGRKTSVVESILDDLEDRVGVPDGSDLDDEQVVELSRLYARMKAMAKGREELF